MNILLYIHRLFCLYNPFGLLLRNFHYNRKLENIIRDLRAANNELKKHLDYELKQGNVCAEVWDAERTRYEDTINEWVGKCYVLQVELDCAHQTIDDLENENRFINLCFYQLKIGSFNGLKSARKLLQKRKK